MLRKVRALFGATPDLGLPSDVAFTPAVKAWQERHGSRASYAKMERKRGWRTKVTPQLEAFLAERESFYLATANAAGQPYIQHRGGPKGFLKAIDERTLGFADFGGNQQYISAGNLSENEQAHIFLMDYATRQRIKLWGRARVVEDDAQLIESLAVEGYDGRPERAFLFAITAWDVNCPQHIKPLYSEEQVGLALAKLSQKIEALEAELERLRAARPE